MAFWVALTLLFVAAVFLRKVGQREHGLPPGPPTLPIIGNLHLLPKTKVHHKFTEWARKYGGIYSLKMGTRTAIVLTDAAAIKELLDRRGATTASRPRRYPAELVSGGLNLGFVPYNNTWRILHKAAHAILTPKSTTLHHPIQQAEATQLLYDILCTPQSFYNHVRRYSSSVIMSVLYGTRAPRYETPEIVALVDVQLQWMRLIQAGATLPDDVVPLVELVPERWAKWKWDAQRIRKMQRNLTFSLVGRAEERLRRGEQNGSYMEELLARQEELGLNREIIGNLGISLLGGGSDTTAAYLNSLILALVAHPEAQKKAHEEMDRVVGENRMPTLDDLEQMPYIRAMILENHRFRPIVPLANHASTAPEEYRGYLIPSGSTIFINTWGIYHDPELYDQPERFLPERYLLTENGTKPGVDGTDLRHNLIYGAGRRICVGIHLAQDSINFNVMNLLWAFDFKPNVDSNGHEIKADTSASAYMIGLTVAPFPFNCRITPRTAEKAEIIRGEFSSARATFKNFEIGLASSEDKEVVAEARHV